MNNAGKQPKDIFQQAYQDHSDAIFRYCLFKISDHEKALDLTQDTFMKTWRYMEGGGEIDNIRAFLYRTAGNLIIDEYRRRKYNESLETLSEETGFEPSVDDTERVSEHLDGVRAIELISQIPETYGEVIFMRYVQELSLKEIAEITGDTENAIAVRIHRGIGKLQKIFNHETK